ncbi:MAG TPA: isochorismate synthase, partial [Opitutales bacterium]|nr:isochorismate synthase [Opitutales bacterium]
MLRVPEERFPRQDPAALAGFIEFCRAEARRDGQPRIGSISLAVEHIDPLAVLQSIYEPHELHFYLEKPAEGEAIAGADAVESATLAGPGRFAAVRDWAAETRGRLIAIGDLDAPRAGPHFFAGFAFADETAEGAAFAPATVFLPRWQVAASQGRYVAVANVRVTPDADPVALARRVQAAHAKFSAFPYDSAAARVTAESALITETGGAGWFEAAVAEALARIRAGAYRKIVLARALDLKQPSPFLPLDALNLLREKYPACYGFSLANGRGQSFIGATPERLARVRGRELLTEALAGSAPRGTSATEDARLGRALLGRAKEAHEHEVVLEAIVRRLKRLGVENLTVEKARLLLLPNVQHLWSPVSAQLPAGMHLLDVLAMLHPTPAVGGQPREAARPDIARLERFDRGLYAGTVGWFDQAGDGEFVVAIRSALMDGTQARLFAGAGIVEGSVPAEEKAETDL